MTDNTTPRDGELLATITAAANYFTDRATTAALPSEAAAFRSRAARLREAAVTLERSLAVAAQLRTALEQLLNECISAGFDTASYYLHPTAITDARAALAAHDGNEKPTNEQESNND